MLDIAPYLHRIGFEGIPDLSIGTLRALHRAHVLNVPFENLDIHLGKTIGLEVATFYDKIVTRRRGGFCYELNGLLAQVLRQIGFDVTLLSARVYDPTGVAGREFAHVLLKVQLEHPLLMDVGFGDASVAPLLLDCDDPQHDGFTSYRLVREADRVMLCYITPEGPLKPKYVFTLTPRVLSDFAGMCHCHQTEPESAFVKRRLCTRATETGRMTLSSTHLTFVNGTSRSETPITAEEQFSAVLAEQFDIHIPPHAWKLPLAVATAVRA